MKFKLILLLAAVLLASGCLDRYIYGEENVPVLYVNVTMGEDANGSMVVEGIEAHAGEMPRFKAPQEVYAGSFPSVQVVAVQNLSKLTYPNGQKYTGPGIYRYVLGFEREINKSKPAAIMVETIINSTEYPDVNGMRFNWSAEVQSKTFK